MYCCFDDSNIKAQLIEESFDYPAGDSIGAHGWVHFSPNSGTLNRIMVTDPGLQYAGFQTQGIGNAATLTNTGQDSYKPLSSVQNSGSVYSFFLVRVDTVRTTGDYFCAFLTSTSSTNFLCRVYARKMSSTAVNFAFGLSKTTTTGGVQWSDTVYTKGTTYLVVMKYTFNSASNTDDEVSLHIFSSGVPSIEPAPVIGPLTGTGTDAADIGRFALRQGSESSAPNLKIDEIFTGTSWSGVLPVEMSSFGSFVKGRDVNLYWSSEGEINNLRFEVERSDVKGQMSNEWTKIGSVAGNGTTSYQNSYTFTDRGLSTGTYNYRLKQIDINGNFEYFNLMNEVNIGIPVKYDLSQNYPNPFNPVTKINFDLPSDAMTVLRIFDISGREVSTPGKRSKNCRISFGHFQCSRYVKRSLLLYFIGRRLCINKEDAAC
ncbi:MAG: hypothetical protein IPL53_13130 [Ignavibacteria bacterium]|nr:hypothetical protein [Ignavibacteria bacterium]